MGCLLHLVLFIATVRENLAQLTEARPVNLVELQHHADNIAKLRVVRKSLLQASDALVDKLLTVELLRFLVETGHVFHSR